MDGSFGLLFLILYSAVALGVGALVMLDVRKRRVIASGGAALILLSTGHPFGGLGNYLIGMAGVALGLAALVLPPKEGGRGAEMGGLGNGALGLLVVVPLALSAWLLTKYWFDPVPIALRHTVSVQVETTDPTVRLITARGVTLPSQARILMLDVYSTNPLESSVVEDVPDCPECSASRLVTIPPSAGGQAEVDLALRLEVPRHQRTTIDESDVIFEIFDG